ncbi:MAG: type II toxin-antitoxin system RatA family toxin [Rickettsiales bacterium]|nr:type II toxin-antitoxin system RatA family toxin [Pseudomonadota bacterium]MDA0965565.1 type II toxin-antitoxin system RatA family toxin [Pseudomonadota bacterium]MDG4542889.1 type II toxin-antitoxin system RatA family toxin [Rickettsiales bacterium]MDG4544663.1 type II toxin-antitoxin system RatA family toxin [Rickettsiales bacterium]MDG4546785.1 type II toxin-antitoxin system RatA family toxin [Rickettsiales bacterium]
MPTHYIEKILPYTPKQLFDLVADIESYPKFIPWCENARIYERDGDAVLADLVIRFRGVTGKYTSRVLIDETEKEISVELAQGPFHHLYQGWKFIKVPEGTRVEFDIDFKIRNFFLEKIADMMFDEACKKMMDAFTKRADQLCKEKA